MELEWLDFTADEWNAFTEEQWNGFGWDYFYVFVNLDSTSVPVFTFTSSPTEIFLFDVSIGSTSIGVEITSINTNVSCVSVMADSVNTTSSFGVSLGPLTVDAKVV